MRCSRSTFLLFSVQQLLCLRSEHVFSHLQFTNSRRAKHLRTPKTTFPPTYIQTYRHTYIHTFIHTDIQTYIHSHIHTYRHTHTHTHTHTQARTHPHTPFRFPQFFQSAQGCHQYRSDDVQRQCGSSRNSTTISTLHSLGGPLGRVSVSIHRKSSPKTVVALSSLIQVTFLLQLLLFPYPPICLTPLSLSPHPHFHFHLRRGVCRTAKFHVLVDCKEKLLVFLQTKLHLFRRHFGDDGGSGSGGRG